MNGCICHKNTYRAKTYNAKFFSLQVLFLRVLFFFLCDLCNIAILFVFLDQLDYPILSLAAKAFPQSQSSFTPFAFCSRRIEYNNPSSAQRSSGILLHLRPHGDHFQVFYQTPSRASLRAWHKNSVCSFCSLHIHIIFIQLIKSYRRIGFKQMIFAI